MVNQMRAVTNRRIKPNYVDAINAQTPYLPQIYQQREDTAFRDKGYGLEQQNLALSEKSLAQSADIARRTEALNQDQLDEQKKQNKRAQQLGWANTALAGASGLANLYQSGKPLLDNIKPDLSSVMSPSVNDALPSVSPEMFSSFSTGAPSIAEGDVSDWWDFGGQGAGPSDLISKIGQGATDFASGIDAGITDYIVDPIKNIGGSIWDAGSSFLDSLGELF